jgi:hypothetical protein
MFGKVTVYTHLLLHPLTVKERPAEVIKDRRSLMDMLSMSSSGDSAAIIVNKNVECECVF